MHTFACGESRCQADISDLLLMLRSKGASGPKKWCTRPDTMAAHIQQSGLQIAAHTGSPYLAKWTSNCCTILVSIDDWDLSLVHIFEERSTAHGDPWWLLAL